MKHNKLCSSFLMQASILLTVVIGVIVFTPFALTTAASADQVAQVIEHSEDLLVDEISVDVPRHQTLYFNGLQWGATIGWNPYSDSMNNAMAIGQQENARVPVWETPYLYNMLDGKQYPLLAAVPWSWSASMTEITFTLKSVAHWSDGASVTADDVAYTWATHTKYGTSVGVAYQDYIDTVEAVDAHTVLVRAKVDGSGRAINPLMVSAYLSSNYVVQKAWTEKLEMRAGGDADALKADHGDDFVASGPYTRYFSDDTRVILVRDDNYWGQDASMWGTLPSPKYLAHTIYPNNAAALAAFKAGEVDVSQSFIPNVQTLWQVDHLPVSTYLPDAPYGIGASLPTAFYNLRAYGLDNVAIRKAIAIAVDYDAIITEAMTNQSATFTQVPRSFMNPTPGEQALYDQAEVAHLQWVGNDIAGTRALLDSAGVVDSNGDGWREYNGQTLRYVATSPNGWSDWQAAMEIVADVGQAIGIQITTDYPEWSDYQNIVTNWPLPTTGFDIFMMWSSGAGPTQPWDRVRNLISSEFAGTTGNWSGNWGGYTNPAADILINAIPRETDPVQLKANYTELTRIYLTDVPSFALMYRPQSFHTVNESVWTNFPYQGDGAIPPVPPLNLIDGWGIAGLYTLTLRPTITLNHDTGAPGSYFTVMGTNFPANSAARIIVNDHELGTVITDPTGGFTAILSTTDASEGQYQVTVTVNPSADVWLSLSSSGSLWPQEGSGPIIVIPPGIAHVNEVYLPSVIR